MTKQLLLIRRLMIIGICVLSLFISQSAYSDSYTLGVGESVTISQAAYAGGVIDNVGLADYLDPHLDFTGNYDGSATITVKSYFDYATEVKLVFIERYQTFYNNRWHTQATTYYKDVTIRCKYQNPEPKKKPTNVLLPERVRVPIGGGRVSIIPVLEPSGAVADSYRWYGHQGSATFLLYEMTDGHCEITGRSPGIGSVSLTVNDSLDARTILEVVDPDNLPPTAVFLPSSIEISIGKHNTLSPVLVPDKSSTAYTWTTEDANVATVNGGKVVGMGVGTTTINVKTKNDLTATCKVIVVRQNGKNDEEDEDDATTGIIDGHHYVDLGLSVKWATCDVGAVKPSGDGAKYAWGETTEKDTYDWSTYLYGSSMRNVTNIGMDIKETKYDAAYIHWGENWRMPTADEIKELVAKCTIKEDYLDGVVGYTVTGPNNNTIFFPIGSYRWSSTCSSNPESAVTLYLNTNSSNVTSATFMNKYRCFGYCIRPVTSSNELMLSNQPNSISVNSSLKLKVNESSILNYSISPTNVTTSISWYSDNPSVAIVSPLGIVTGIKAGRTKIHVKTSNGKTAYCDVTVTSMTPIVQVVAGGSHSQFVEKDGTLHACGSNSYGEFGNGTISGSLCPIVIQKDIKCLSSKWHSLFIKNDNSLWGCGSNASGELGDGTTKNKIQPIKMMDDVSYVSAGNDYSLIIKSDGTLWVCGENGYGQLGDGTHSNTRTLKKTLDNVSKVFAGNYHSLILKKDGTLLACGKNNYGQLGIETKTDQVMTPFKIMDNVTSAALGYYHSLILKEDGTLWMCGNNSAGQLGYAKTSEYYQTTPKKIMDNVVEVAADGYYSLILKKDRTLWGCGNFGLGESIKADKGPVKIMENVASVTTHSMHTIVMKTDGTIWAFGTNSYGEIGDGTTVNRYPPVQIIKVQNEGGDDQGTMEWQITTSSSGYATFYDSKSSYTLPNGLSAQVVTSVTNNKLTYKVVANGSVSGVVPKSTAVMLKNDAGKAGSFTLTPSTSTTTYSGTNLLHGSDEATTTMGDGYHYKLSYGKSGSANSNVFGWYWGEQNGGPFQIEGHKAWLVVPKSASARSFSIDGDVTGIDDLTTGEIMEDVYFDLQGRRINKPTVKGIYVRNGKKVMIR